MATQGTTKQQMLQDEKDIEEKLIYPILREISDNLSLGASHPTFGNSFNPFKRCAGMGLLTTRNFNSNYQIVVDGFGCVDYAIVACYSPLFIYHLETRGPDHRETWESAFITELVARLATWKESFMNMALSYGLNPRDHYEAFAVEGKPSLEVGNSRWANALEQKLTVAHPHEFYLNLANQRQPSLFENTDGKQSLMKNIEQSIYKSEYFARVGRPEGRWPKEKGWPPKWNFPSRPDEPSIDRHTYPTCMECGLSTRPSRGLARRKGTKLCGEGGDLVDACRDGYAEPLVEIRQLTPIPGDGAKFNRGVIALEPIDKDTLLGEYLAVYIPLGESDYHKDNKYGFAFDGPPLLDLSTMNTSLRTADCEYESDGETLVEVKPICELISGSHGNWTRFMNHSSREPNVEYRRRIFAGKNRMVAVSLRDIRPGTELLVDYGPEYFNSPEFRGKRSVLVENEHDKKHDKRNDAQRTKTSNALKRKLDTKDSDVSMLDIDDEEADFVKRKAERRKAVFDLAARVRKRRKNIARGRNKGL